MNDESTKVRHPDSEARHPIGVVATRTGLNPSLLRAWERRYGVVEPARSEGGRRLYSDAHIAKLSLLQRVTEAGRAIGDVADLPVEELRRLAEGDEAARRALARRTEVVQPSRGEELSAQIRERALESVAEVDADELERTLRRGAAALGGLPFMEEVVAPLLRDVGERWAEGRLRPAHEHVATAVVRRVLGWLADPLAERDGPAVVVGTLAGERHELGALLAATTAGLEGWSITFLGPDLPPEDIARAASEVGAKVVALGAVNPPEASGAERALAEVRRLLPPEVELVVGGAAAGELVGPSSPAGIRRVASLPEFRDRLRELDAG